MTSSTSKALQEAEKLVATLKELEAKGTPSSAEHQALLKSVDNVRMALEEPYDIITRWLEAMAASSALLLLIKTGSLQRLPADGSSISAKELAKAANIDLSAITRAFRVILVNGIATETAPDEYTHNLLSQVLQPEALGSFFLICMDTQKAWIELPEYFQKHQPEEVYDLKKSPFAFAFGKEGLTYYEILNEDIVKRNIWNKTLEQMEANMPILGMFPFATLKEQVEKEPERPFIVDVGGGKGQAMLAIETECPKFFGGKVILQDLPIVIDSLKSEDLPGIKPTAHDIFTPQPIKNAHVYFMRRLLHDFYNPVCVEILKNIVPAMGPDSRLIICDMIVPEMVEIGGPQQLYWLDFSMLILGGKEKTITEFTNIFNEVGLELVKVYPSGVGTTSMLETRLKASMSEFV
ncbi:S-adenosyl-L-methionine-dependent methyltransferase [Stipitochalara longipes BDJ]|nr:S-adenosyl-L-methionine-dependent methyltransferase [Stipitochalara longipes BDJ]